MEHDGQTIQEPIITRSGNFTGRYRIKKHPALAVAKDRATEILIVLRRFGLTPVDRHKVFIPNERSTVAPDDDDDDFDSQLIDLSQQ